VIENAVVSQGDSAADRPLDGFLRARSAQAIGVAIAFVAIAALHSANDGLWLGDAPLHAGSGLFWRDLLAMRPTDPIDFGMRYFARYPVVQPTTYPPLFYLIEGLAFALAGASPHVAKLVVLPFGIVIGLYTMAWARRWVGPEAGWAGTFLAFVPGVLVWTNAVMLNIPATALGIASLYHFRRWLDTGASKQIVFVACLLAAVMLTYYPGAIVLVPIGVFAVLRWRDVRLDRRLIWIGAAALCAALPLVVSVLLSPVHTSRHVPSLKFLTRTDTWMWYLPMLPRVTGSPVLILGTAGAAAAFLTTRWRSEAVLLSAWVLVLIAGLSLLPARDARYIMLAAPAFVVAAAIGVAIAADVLRPGRRLQAAALAAALAGGCVYAVVRVPVPEKTGFRDIAVFLEQQAPNDAVLYDGPNGALLGFYVGASDPRFQRRVTLAETIVYHYGPGRTFYDWTQTSNVATPDEVVALLRTRCGCRWVAVEDWPQPAVVTGRQLLRQALSRSDFELVRSFPVTGAFGSRVDLYRLGGEVATNPALDFSFPSFSAREFRGVVPITR
jgi:hypothetical protein